MTKPNQVLIWMGGFLIAVGVLAAAVAPRLLENFQANPFFNAVILAVLVFGILVNLRQVLMLSREVVWIDTFRRSDPARPLTPPKLLAPMARMFSGRERATFSLSTPSLRSILDSVYLRLEESRDLSRYLVGRGDLPRPARHVLGPARDDPLGRRDHRLARRRHRSRRDVQPAQGTAEAAAVRHVDEFLDVAVRPGQFARARLPRPASGARAEPLLQRARRVAVGHDQAIFRRPAHRWRDERAGLRAGAARTDRRRARTHAARDRPIPTASGAARASSSAN